MQRIRLMQNWLYIVQHTPDRYQLQPEDVDERDRWRNMTNTLIVEAGYFYELCNMYCFCHQQVWLSGLNNAVPFARSSIAS